jgi:hypothetical protein
MERLLETVGPNMPFKTKRLVELAANPNYRFGDGSLYDLMNRRAPQGDKINIRSLGKWISKLTDKHAGRFVIQRHKQNCNGSVTFIVRPI